MVRLLTTSPLQNYEVTAKSIDKMSPCSIRPTTDSPTSRNAMKKERWADFSSDEEDSSKCPPSPCSTVAPGEPAMRSWADYSSDEEFEQFTLEQSCIPGISDVRNVDRADGAKCLQAEPVAVAAASRPQFARANREQRIQQVSKAVDELLALSFDDVAAEEQESLACRMLATLKSLAATDIYWTAAGDRQEEERYSLLGLEEDDMFAIGQHVRKADKHCERRKFRKAFDAMCEARTWLQADDLSILRADWKRDTEVKNSKREAQRQETEQEIAAGWQVISGGKGAKNTLKEGGWSTAVGKTSSAPSHNNRKQKSDNRWSTPASSTNPPASSTNKSLHRAADPLEGRPALAKSVPGKPTNRNRQQRGRAITQCQFFIGIEEDRTFSVVRKVLGGHGANVKRIAEQSGAKLRLRGCGSGFLEGPENRESTDPLMLCVSAPDTAAYEVAKNMVTEVLESVYEQHREYCRKSGKKILDVCINVHEGYRPGAR